MKATLLHEPFLTVRDICDGFVYNELEGKGLFGWGASQNDLRNPKKIGLWNPKN